MELLHPGDRSAAAAEVRAILAALGLLNNTHPATVDVLDPAADRALRAFQQNRGLTVDGIVGPDTYRALYSARWRLGDRVLIHNATAPQHGDDVESLQNNLLGLGYDSGRADGLFGPLTEKALRNFQRDSGLLPDGVCAGATLRALDQLGRRIVGGRPQLLREMAAVADARICSASGSSSTRATAAPISASPSVV